jgi:hypothetical protein
VSHWDRLDSSIDLDEYGFDSYRACPHDLGPWAVDTSCGVVSWGDCIVDAGAILETHWEGEPCVYTGPQRLTLVGADREG